ncbi:MAG: hypothetical protein KJO35_00155, partial [Gammaproteobacteria bacterium]|nr:hypothetical protein [Gammaproteobacteria bacterium]
CDRCHRMPVADVIDLNSSIKELTGDVMNENKRKPATASHDSGRDWDPYKVWQKHIKEVEAKPADEDMNPTGSWRTDTVWQTLIKG